MNSKITKKIRITKTFLRPFAKKKNLEKVE